MSEGFSADWLALREPYDAAARSSALLDRLTKWRRGRDALRMVDLGAGTGSNLRCAAPALGGGQDWTLAELDPKLVAAGQERLATTLVGWRYRQLDLARDLELLADQAVDLITASALIDLVSEAWLRRLVAWRASAGAALHIVLSYDGRLVWQPADDGDAEVCDLVNRHQQVDKGFGLALGPKAVAALSAMLADAGGELLIEPSDWDLEEGNHELQLALANGHAMAAMQMAPERAGTLSAWAGRRRAAIREGRSRLRIGHLDLLFLPRN
jgi:hypothetical protein